MVGCAGNKDVFSSFYDPHGIIKAVTIFVLNGSILEKVNPPVLGEEVFNGHPVTDAE